MALKGSAADITRQKAAQLADDIGSFLHNHCHLYDRRVPNDIICLITPHPFGWQELKDAGRLEQSRLLQRYARLKEWVTCLVPDHRQQSKEIITDAFDLLGQVLEQEPVSEANVDSMATAVNKALTEISTSIEAGFDPAPDRHCLVPDTNALLYNTDLPAWRFAECRKFSLILLPTVLGELDKHKMGPAEKPLTNKAAAVCGLLKDCRRRGNIIDGVTLSKGVSTIAAIGVEPDFDQTLSWLDTTIPDDRILASTVDLMRRHPRCAVILVTRDSNLIIKADMVGFPVISPPERCQ